MDLAQTTPFQTLDMISQYTPSLCAFVLLALLSQCSLQSVQGHEALSSSILPSSHYQETSRLRERQIDLLTLSSNGSRAANAHDFEGKEYKPRHLAGYFRLNRTHEAEMFYMFYEHRHSPDGPLILWMTGGPGCSSELAAFYENGPYQVNENLTVRANAYGWDNAGSIIYVDQPINSGFSYSNDERDRVFNENLVGADMIDFFEAFVEAHPEYKDRDLYITGESFAGHYIPVVAYSIILHNQLQTGTFLKLRGIAIGNGLTNAGIQFASYAPYAYEEGLISKAFAQGMKLVYPVCESSVNFCNGLETGVLKDLACCAANQICQKFIFEPITGALGNANIYDIRKPCIGELCYDFSVLEKYLAQPHVRKELGVEKEFKFCNWTVNHDLEGDDMRRYDDLVRLIMYESDFDVMLYVGVKDFICNWIGNEQWLNEMEWTNQTEFLKAPELTWNVGGKAAGSVRKYDRLSFVKIYDAGHLSPMDQPENLLELINRFVRKEPLNVASAISSDSQKLNDVGPLQKRLQRRPFIVQA